MNLRDMDMTLREAEKILAQIERKGRMEKRWRQFQDEQGDALK